MVLIIEPGTEVESCYMAGRGMNGLKGVVVCFNPNNQRYTIELEKGDMMSLKIRNVREVTVRPSGEDGEDAKEEDTKAEPTPAAEPFQATTSGGGIASSSLPNFPAPETINDKGINNDTNEAKQQNIFDMISPVNAILIVLVAYFYFNAANSMSDNTRHHRPSSVYKSVSVPVMATFAIFSYLAWDWGTQPSRGYPRGDFNVTNLGLKVYHMKFWEIVGISGLVLWCLEVSTYSIVSAGILCFFLWQFGTRGGRVNFNWNNVTSRVSNLSIWEALMLAGVLQEGLHFLNSLARRR